MVSGNKSLLSVLVIYISYGVTVNSPCLKLKILITSILMKLVVSVKDSTFVNSFCKERKFYSQREKSRCIN